jgi:fatty acid-binding protein DegV
MVSEVIVKIAEVLKGGSITRRIKKKIKNIKKNITNVTRTLLNNTTMSGQKRIPNIKGFITRKE